MITFYATYPIGDPIDSLTLLSLFNVIIYISCVRIIYCICIVFVSVFVLYTVVQ